MGTGAVEVGRLNVGAMMAGMGKTALQMTCTPVKFLAREGVALAGSGWGSGLSCPGFPGEDCSDLSGPDCSACPAGTFKVLLAQFRF